MGAGAAAKQKYGAAEEAEPKKPQPKVIKAKAKAQTSGQAFDNNAWRAPKPKGASSSTVPKPGPPIRGPGPPIRGPGPPLQTKPLDNPFTVKDEAEEETEVSTWSPRQGGLSKRERETLEAKKKEKEEAAKKTPVVPVKLALPGPPLPGLMEFEANRPGNEGPSPKSVKPGEKPLPGILAVEDNSKRTGVPSPKAAGTGLLALPTSPKAAGTGLLSLPGVMPEESAGADAAAGQRSRSKEAAEEPEEPADYAVLADAADKVWKELLFKISGCENGMKDLFLFQELKESVEAATKRINAVQRKASTAAGAVDVKQTELGQICERIERDARHDRMGAAQPWKRGNLAVRRGRFGLCELLAVHRVNGAMKVEVRMVTSGSFASPEVTELVPLTKEQLATVRKKMDEIEQAKQDQATVDLEVQKVQKELKVEYRKLNERLDKELQKHEMDEYDPRVPALAPPGLPAMDLVLGWSDKKAAPPPMPSYPNMDNLFSAAQAVLLTSPAAAKADHATGPTTAAHSLLNTPTHGSDPSMPTGGIAGGMTRDMLPTPMRFRTDENVDGDSQDGVDELCEEVALSPIVSPKPEASAEDGEWDEYEDADGDKYYHNAKTGVTAWELPPGARLRKDAAPEPEPAAAEQKTAETVEEATRPGIWQNIIQDFDISKTSPESIGKTSPPRGAAETTPMAGNDTSTFPSACTTGASQAPAPQPEAQPQSPKPQTQPQTLERQSSEWIKYETAEGAPYYHNERTGETRWDLPPGETATEPKAEEDEEEEECPQNDAWTAQKGVGTASTTVGSSVAAQAQAQAQQAQAQAQQDWYQQQAQAQAAAAAQAQQQQEQWAQYAAYQQAAAQQAQQQAQQQQEQWAQYYAQYWSWFQQQQETRQEQGAPEAASELAPPPPDAKVEDQIAFAMKSYVLKQMETMLENGATLAERKKAMKDLQIKWHPDKNPDQKGVANNIFQMLGEKKEWFLHDAAAADAGLEMPVDAVD